MPILSFNTSPLGQEDNSKFVLEHVGNVQQSALSSGQNPLHNAVGAAAGNVDAEQVTALLPHVPQVVDTLQVPSNILALAQGANTLS